MAYYGNSNCHCTCVSRLSLKYEPSQTPELRKRHTAHTITPVSAMKHLRASRSQEDILRQLAAEVAAGNADTESPFSLDQRNSLMRRSLNTSSRERLNSTPSKDLFRSKLVKHKLSVPGLNDVPRDEHFSSASVEVKKTTTLPVNLQGADFSAEFMRPKPRSASDWASSSKKHVDSPGVPSFSDPFGGHPPSAPQRPPPSSPMTQAKAKKEAQGHKKSHSVGSK